MAIRSFQQIIDDHAKLGARVFVLQGFTVKAVPDDGEFSNGCAKCVFRTVGCPSRAQEEAAGTTDCAAFSGEGTHHYVSVS